MLSPAQTRPTVAIDTVALQPLRLGADFKQSESIRLAFEALIRAELQASGRTVVASDHFARILHEEAVAAGGFYNPRTGLRIEDKYRLVHEKTYERMRQIYGADAVLEPEILIVLARYDDTKAKWCNTSQAIRGTLSHFFGDGLGGVSRSGELQASCLRLTLRDARTADATPLMDRQHGIETLVTMQDQGKLVARDALFADPERNRDAVRGALCDILAEARCPEDELHHTRPRHRG